MANDKSPCPERKKIIAGYANYFEIGHNAFEFLIDFGQIDPQNGEININSRLAFGPTHAKLFARLLESAVKQYEKQFDLIADISDEDLLGTILNTTADFERRANDARRRPSSARSKSDAKQKR